jgi:hypothetical protein
MRLFAKERLRDYKDGATILTHLYALPSILVLHIQRFTFGDNVRKIQKRIEYPIHLQIKPNWLSAHIRSKKPVQYRLYAGM